MKGRQRGEEWEWEDQYYKLGTTGASGGVTTSRSTIGGSLNVADVLRLKRKREGEGRGDRKKKGKTITAKRVTDQQ